MSVLEDAVAAAQQYVEDAMRLGVLEAPDLTGWAWLPRAREIDGRYIVTIVSPEAVLASVEACEAGRTDEQVTDAITLEMERTDDGWRYVGQPTWPSSPTKEAP